LNVQFSRPSNTAGLLNQKFGNVRSARMDALAPDSYQEFMPATFVYRCPNTGFDVQGWVADDPTEGEAE
jgi:hypothetical protein